MTASSCGNAGAEIRKISLLAGPGGDRMETRRNRNHSFSGNVALSPVGQDTINSSTDFFRSLLPIENRDALLPNSDSRDSFGISARNSNCSFSIGESARLTWNNNGQARQLSTVSDARPCL